ncbi:putative adaptin [Neospora caninum Liverpool]|uniref:Adaptin, putative n=1 Tax=Neospora caninum (strain Liverpool) TaxID=572307 RepID=F0VMJ9_NEOCL|nr:putative adaptin [Neospora caninum Liverpool]CBZ54945.1 putative adaptin [Neospora caninum Liverpool]CEL69667.1 TPA: adaptin, putative [Neospora caninum Liverpool]|eukprot:XP_003884973.1 putative adaptin [Neospora caninum Liverpool]
MSLPSLIRGFRAAQQEGTEDEYLSLCLQQIKEELTPTPGASSQSLSSLLGRSPSASARSSALLKLTYLQMLGFDIGFATFSVVEGMSVQSFSLKRPAYAACALAFALPLASRAKAEGEHDAENGRDRKNLAEEKQQQQQALSLLTTNLFKKDFTSKETHETSLALSTLAVMSTPEIAAALLPDVLLLLSSSRPVLRKKASVCATRFLIQVPSLLPSSFPKLRQQLMAEEETPVVSCLCSALLQLVAEKPQQYLSLAPPLFHLLCNSTSNWLSLKLLKIFAQLCPFEPRLPLKLLRPLLTLLQQSRAKSVEVEILRLGLLHFPLEGPAARARGRATALAPFLAGAEDSREAPGEEGREENGEGESELDAFLRSCLSRTHALLASADRNLRCVGVDILAALFARKRDLAGDVAACIPDFHKFVLQAAEECDPTLRSRGIDLLTKTATPASFPRITEQLVSAAAAHEAQTQGRVHSRGDKAGKDAERGHAFSPAVAGSLRASFLLPLLKMGAENHYALIEDFEWYLALLASLAVDGGSEAVDACRDGAEEEDKDASVAGLVAEQLVDITVRVPAVRPCAALLASLICDSAVAPSSASRETLRRIHRSHQQQAGVLREPGEDAETEKEKETSSPVAPVVVRAAAWIVGEYFECLDSQHADENAEPRDGEGSVSFYFDACRSLIRLARSLLLPSPVQQVVLAAAMKVFLGACNASSNRFAATPEKRSFSAQGEGVRGAGLRELQEAMLAMLDRCKAAAEGENGSSPSSSVEVYDRVRLAEQLVRFFGPGDKETLKGETPLRLWGLEQGTLLPVLPGAQQQVPLDASLDLSTPFFDYRRLQSQPSPQSGSAVSPGAVHGVWEQKGGDGSLGLPQSPPEAGAVSVSSVEASLLASGSPQKGDTQGAGVGWARGAGAPSGAKKRFEVIRSAIAPGQSPQASSCGASSSERPGGAVSPCLNGVSLSPVSSSPLPTALGSGGAGERLSEKDRRSGKCLPPAESAQEAGVPFPVSMQLQLKSRLWRSCGRDDALRVFCCVGEALGPTAPDAPPALSVGLCCEKAENAGADISEVGLAFDEAAALRLPNLVPLAAELKKRSNRGVVKPASFSSPLCCTSTAELSDWRLEGKILYTAAGSVPSGDFSLLDGDTGPLGGPAPQRVQQRETPFAIEIPATVGLLPLQMTEDELASFFAQTGGIVTAQHSDRVEVQPRAPSPASGCTDTWCISLRGCKPTSPLAVLQYLRVVACTANLFLLPQQPLPSPSCSSGVLKCLLIARLYNPDTALQLHMHQEKMEGEAAAGLAAPPNPPEELSGHHVVLAFVACSCGGDSAGEKDRPSEEAKEVLHFRVNARSASAACSEAVCRWICNLLEETVSGRLHVFTE